MLGKLFLRKLRTSAIAGNKFTAVSVDPANPTSASSPGMDDMDPANNPFDKITASSTDEELNLVAEMKAIHYVYHRRQDGSNL